MNIGKNPFENAIRNYVMAKIYKTKLTEAEQIVDENVAQEPAVPATPDEVAQAQEAPVAQDSIVEEPVEEAPAEVTEEPAEEKTVSIEMTIPADQLAAAVAQATGDVAVAETAPDAVAEQEAQAPAEEPLVAQEDTDKIEVVGEEGQDVIEDSDQATTITEATDIHGNPGYKVAKETEDKLNDLIDAGVKNMADDLTRELKTGESKIKESEEVCPECGKNPCECECKDDECLEESCEEKPLKESEKDEIKEAGKEEDKEEDKEEEKPEDAGEKLDFSKIGEPEDGELPGGFEADDDLGEGGMDTSIFDDFDGEEAGFEDIVGQLDGLFKGSSEDVAQVADVLETTAKVMDAVAEDKAEEEAEDGEAPNDDAYLLSSLLDDDEEPLDFDKISDFGYDDEEEEESAYEEADDDDDAEDEDLEESVVRVPCKFPKKSDVIREYKSRLHKEEKVQESLDGIIYPAGSEPELSEPLVTPKAPNLVEAHERAIESRRNAINKFRESIKRENEDRSNRFREALRSSVQVSRSASSNPNSWSNNQFIEKYEESQKLDFSRLFEDGFLG